jgi:MHS family alpha-ketoglutarate permease-like MFS transporter
MQAASPAQPLPNEESIDQARRSSIVVGAIGNFVEFYDWTIYAIMAPVFASQFFPSDDPTVAVLQAYLTFALGYVARPLGSLLLGAYSDRKGRRAAMTLAILGMALCSLIIGLCPPYATIGVAAPVILVIVRMLQGVSAGGEAGSATTYLVEFARPGRRALAGSFQQISTGLSTLGALGTSALLSAFLSQASLAAWGWRVPFVIGAVLGLIGLYLRLRAGETPVFKRDVEATVDRQPVLPSLAQAWRSVLLVSGIALLPSIAYLSWQILLPVYITITTGLSRGDATNISLIGVVVFLLLIVPSALLSDRVGRRPMMIGYSIGVLLWAYPTFVGIPTFASSYTGLVIVTVVGNIILAAMAGSIVACMVEQFDTLVRASGNGLSYAIGIVVSGATFPPIMTALARSHDYVWLTLYVIAMAVISLVAYWIMPETRDRPLSRSAGR